MKLRKKQILQEEADLEDIETVRKRLTFDDEEEEPSDSEVFYDAYGYENSPGNENAIENSLNNADHDPDVSVGSLPER